MSDKAVIKELRQRIENLTRMNEILRKLVLSLAKKGPSTEQEDDKPGLH